MKRLFKGWYFMASEITETKAVRLITHKYDQWLNQPRNMSEKRLLKQTFTNISCVRRRSRSLPTCMTRRLSPVISASFCSVWASGLLSWANWDCITCTGTHTGQTTPTPRAKCSAHVRPRAESTCSCSAVNDVRALLAGFGWQSWSEGRAPSRVSPVPSNKHTLTSNHLPTLHTGCHWCMMDR